MTQLKRMLTGILVLSVAALLVTVGIVDAGGARKSESEVKVSATAAKPDAGGKQVVNIVMDVNKGWHVYANPVGNEQFDGAKTVVNIASKVKPADVKFDFPTAKVVVDKDVGNYKVYEDKVKITATVQRAAGDTGPLEVTVNFSACNSTTCLPESKIKLMVP